ncbi:MAG: spore germination protein [Clostridia bacterium]|nr:spore germination protein [Clostridia bacterium]
MKGFKRLFQKKETDIPGPKLDSEKNIKQKLPKDLEKKQELIKPFIIKSKDVISRSFMIQGEKNISAVVIYLEGVIDSDILNRDILKPLMIKTSIEETLKQEGTKHFIERIYRSTLTIGQVQKVNTLAELVQNIYDGFAVLLFDGFTEALMLDIRLAQERSVEEPDTEKTLRGPREGFIENLVTNIAIIRRKIRDPNLVVEKTMVGKRTRTDLAFLYIEDIADPKIVSEVKNRINKINIDGILTTGYIEQLMEDNPYSFFPQIQVTERPDKVAANLLEGKVAIMANETPVVLIVPSLFVQFLQGSEDYYERTITSSFSRGLRFLAFFLAISLPPLYIALVSFEQELIPLKLILSLAEARKQVPFPAAIEALAMEIIIQLMVETGLRLPSSVGQTVGVVGAIVLGQAAISADLASPAIVIIIAVTTICNFALPTYSMALTVRIIRIPMMLLASAFGIFGFSIGWVIILTHLISLESVSVPYFTPFAPLRFKDLKDSFYRTFLWKMNNRPESIPTKDKKRQSPIKGGTKK